MSKWKVTAYVADPDDMSANEVLDSVRWSLEDSVEMEAMTVTGLLIEPAEVAGRARLKPAYVEPDCDPTTGICFYGRMD